MNRNLKRVKTTLAVSGLLALAAVVGLGSGSSTALGANSTASAPEQVNWINPVNVSNSQHYNQTPWLGVSPINGAVTVAYEERSSTADFTKVGHVSNTTLAGPFLPFAVLEQSGSGFLDRNVRAAEDSLGRRWMAWWGPGSTGLCGYIARIETNGVATLNEEVPGTCLDSTNARKNVALAVGPDNFVHVLFGRNNENIFYYRADPNGSWNVIGEQLPGTGNPGNLALAVSSLGTVMAAYTANGSAGHSKDIYTDVRNPAGGWQPRENISAPVNAGDSRISGHLPALERDYLGGIRAVWGQTKVDPWVDPGNDDVYYREWTPAGWSGTIYRITNNSGQSYDPDVEVDANNVAHIAWGDDTGRTRGNFRVFYGTFANGQFTSSGAIFDAQFGSNYQKEPSLGYNPGGQAAIHIAFGSPRTSFGGDPKENWYSYQTSGPVVTPTPVVTNTPSATPTPCTVGNFRDVVPTDYFYTAVRDLAQRGIMSGYSDCTFRPYNVLTRGQASKIVVLGAELPINTSGGPHFSDVLPGSTFYNYVETAVNAGIVSGYADGTFRPNNVVTRGQFSKMVILAFEFPVYAPPQPTFSDVPPTNAFFQYVEGAYRLGLISGYADGTFRPFNNITRGQAAKIVYSAREIASNTPTSTAIVVTATATESPFVITATPTSTPVVVTSTPTNTPNVVTATPTSTATP